MANQDKLLSGRMNARFSAAVRRRAASYLSGAIQQMLLDSVQQATEMPDEADGILSDALDAQRLMRALAAELTANQEIV